MHDDLTRFIDHARQNGMDHATIIELLRSSGWKDKEIAAAIAKRELDVPIPERSGIGSARDAFFHLLAFTALYAWAVSLVLLVFAYIDFAFPDPAIRVSAYAIDAAPLEHACVIGDPDRGVSAVRGGLGRLVTRGPSLARACEKRCAAMAHFVVAVRGRGHHHGRRDHGGLSTRRG